MENIYINSVSFMDGLDSKLWRKEKRKKNIVYFNIYLYHCVASMQNQIFHQQISLSPSSWIHFWGLHTIVNFVLRCVLQFSVFIHIYALWLLSSRWGMIWLWCHKSEWSLSCDTVHGVHRFHMEGIPLKICHETAENFIRFEFLSCDSICVQLPSLFSSVIANKRHDTQKYDCPIPDFSFSLSTWLFCDIMKHSEYMNKKNGIAWCRHLISP